MEQKDGGLGVKDVVNGKMIKMLDVRIPFGNARNELPELESEGEFAGSGHTAVEKDFSLARLEDGI